MTTSGRGRPPPSPGASRSRQTVNWMVRPYPYLDACHREFGDVFTLRLHALGDVVMLADPDDVAAVFRMDPGHAKTGEANELMTLVVGHESLFVLDGEAHTRRRAELRSSVAARPPIDPEVVGRITAEELPAGGGVIGANTLFRWLALRIISHRVLGTDDPAALRPLGERIRWLTGPLSAVAAFFPLLRHNAGAVTPGYWFDRKVRAADAALADTVRQAGHRAEGQSVVEQLRWARGSSPSGALGPVLRDDLVTLVTAGDDTVASALSWALFWIARTPRVQERLIDSLPPGADTDAILDCEYLQAACQEALRITPVVDIVSRKTTVPIKLGGFDIPVGSLLSPAIYLVHRRPDIFADPAIYCPERFLGRQYRPYEYLPFGGGVRRCLGAALATFEMRLVIGTILARYRVSPATMEAGELRYARRNVTVAPADPLSVRLTPRAR